MIGETLGHYEILQLLGAGGMGEVYGAHDKQLDRQVALKVLPPSMAGSEERLARFRREAKMLASLNHPNIVTVYSVEEVAGIHFLTMELLEGKTLADYSPSKGVPLVEFFEISIAMADALSTAHDSGVIHRDLKPSNVFRTASGRIKILDFGLAKLLPLDPFRTDTEASTEALTGEGRVLGTVPFMSPEQLEGKTPDRRSDIFSLGIILYQLATGRRPFKGATSAEVISSILRDLPEPVDDLRSELPHQIGLIVGMCLEKDPENRFQSAKDLRNELAILSREVTSDRISVRRVTKRMTRRPSLGWLLATALGLIIIGFIAYDALTDSGDTPEPMRIPMPVPEDLRPVIGFGPTVAISPDGRHVALALEEATGSSLFVKGPDELDVRKIAGTEGARTPFFSPDGVWLAFFDDYNRKLKKVSLRGGEPIAIADADYQWGADWAADGTIVFSSIYGGLMRVSAEGGVPEPITKAGAFQHSWPSLLPGDETVIFTILEARGSFDAASIATVPLAGGEPEIVFESGYFPHYAESGHLVFVQKDSVVVAPFDRRTLRVTGPVTTVLEDVWTSAWTGYADFAFSENGTLLYVSGGPDRTQASLDRVDTNGGVTPILDEPRPYTTPRISPDGSQIAFTVGDQDVDIWIWDLERESLSRFTDSPSWDAYPQWQPTKDWIAFSSMREGLPGIFRKHPKSETVERLFVGEHPNYPHSWSPEGELLAFTEEHPDTGLDIWVFRMKEKALEPFLRTDHNEFSPAISPDGRFIAYESDESGRQSEIHVRPYPQFNPDIKVSTAGGGSPHWGPSGKEIFYLAGRKMMVVDFATDPEVSVGSPREIFEGAYNRSFDISPDGQWFVMINEMSADAKPMRINFIANWFSELGQLSASGR